ncbi:hypothetical protein WQ57_06710 [Mesobacillus campisalis]|uniref:Uncharacterized protein n=1 Tax=Mesobacillus campisalis TaxID=1408103 RepID=A0A0M2SVT6_9BACI|nr:hypothetical protein [Mesobacillus campisalis]KKK38679.1 hypothetical protein WQ57_06710 [Mesobacillus campisalis]
MKIIGISLLILGSLMGLSLATDLYMGLEPRTSVRNAISPLTIMETPEYAVFITLILILIWRTLLHAFKERQKRQT